MVRSMKQRHHARVSRQLSSQYEPWKHYPAGSFYSDTPGGNVSLDDALIRIKEDNRTVAKIRPIVYEPAGKKEGWDWTVVTWSRTRGSSHSELQAAKTREEAKRAAMSEARAQERIEVARRSRRR